MTEGHVQPDIESRLADSNEALRSLREKDQQLPRVLGLVEATAIVLGGIIGSGIFLAPAIVAREVGTPGLTLGVWVVCGLLTTCGALCYVELSGAIPETGGTYAFLGRIYDSKLIAFLFGWTTFFAISAGTIAAGGTAFASYSGYFLARYIPYSEWMIRCMAVLCILFLTSMNYMGARIGASIQNVLTVIKVGSLVALILVCLVFGHSHRSQFQPLLPSGKSSPATILASFGTAMISVLFAYEGWTFSTHVAGEVKNPRRNIPLSIVLGMGVAFALYLAANVAYIYVLPFEQLRQSTMVATDALTSVVGGTGGTLIAIAVMISTFGGANTLLLSFPRIQYAMSRDDLFFRWMGEAHPRFHGPSRAILTQGLLASAFALSGTYERILSYISFSQYLFLTLTVAGLIILRRKEPSLYRPHKVWGYPLTPLVFVLTCSWYLVNALVYRFHETMVGVSIMLSGVPFYMYWSQKKKRQLRVDPRR